MRNRFCAAVTLCLGLAAGSAGAASLTLESFTIPPSANTTISRAPVRDVTGPTIATGFNMRDGVSTFIAWCLDLTHRISKGGPYQYEATTTPFSNSFLAGGAASRVQSVFDANYGALDTSDKVTAAAFQLSLWEVAYDNDFSLLTGAFRGGGHGSLAASISSAAAGFLTAAKGYAGREQFDLTFLESRDRNTRQNLVTATPAAPVPLPAALPLLAGGLGGMAALYLRRRRATGTA